MIVRRARPHLGTFVEVGVCTEARLELAHAAVEAANQPDAEDAALDTVNAAHAAIGAAFAVIAHLEACLSRFNPASDIARFNALPVGACLDAIAPDTARVLRAAQALEAASDGAFDISTGSAPRGWRLVGARLEKLDARTRLDLGGIGKGHAVDCAVAALRDHGARAGWVNAGGDLRVFGPIEVPLLLRDENGGGARPFARLADGAFATSHYGAGARCALAGAASDRTAHVSVAAPTCLEADALTKIVALSGDARHPLVAAHGARAWLH